MFEVDDQVLPNRRGALSSSVGPEMDQQLIGSRYQGLLVAGGAKHDS
jgi:hypothetical protein